MRALAVALLLASFGGRAEAKVRVVTTIESFADLARRIGGDRVEVTSLSRGYQDPHFVEPKPSLVVALNRADLVVHVGLELEVGWLPPLLMGARNERIQAGQPGNLEASAGIQLLDVPATKVDRSMGDIHPQGNPHYWATPANGLIVAKEICERLKAIDAAGGASFDANLRRFSEELTRRRAEWERRAAGLRGTKIVPYHKSWSYVSEWLGLKEVGYIEPKPGTPAPPSHIAALIGVMQREKVKAIVMESYFPRNTAELIAKKADTKVLVLPSDVGAVPEIKDYFTLIDAIITKLTAN